MSEGLVIAGRYRLLAKLGAGGMGAVWRAEHLTLGSPVAVKLIDPAIAQSEEALARFRREAQAAAELRSVHVVQILDYGVDRDTPYMVMEPCGKRSGSETPARRPLPVQVVRGNQRRHPRCNSAPREVHRHSRSGRRRTEEVANSSLPLGSSVR